MERQFKGVWIPADIWLHPDLSAFEKMFYAEVDSFTGRGSTFWKANDTIALEHRVSASSVKRAISHLRQLGLIEQVSYDGRTRHLRSCSQIRMSYEMGQIDPSARSEAKGQTAQIELQEKQEKNTIEASKKIEYPEGWGEAFTEAWRQWKEYKAAEHRFHFKSLISEQTTIHKLYNDTNGSEEAAIHAIGRSIAAGWKGIFADTNRGSKRDAPANATTTIEWADR